MTSELEARDPAKALRVSQGLLRRVMNQGVKDDGLWHEIRTFLEHDLDAAGEARPDAKRGCELWCFVCRTFVPVRWWHSAFGAWWKHVRKSKDDRHRLTVIAPVEIFQDGMPQYWYEGMVRYFKDDKGGTKT